MVSCIGWDGKRIMHITGGVISLRGPFIIWKLSKGPFTADTGLEDTHLGIIITQTYGRIINYGASTGRAAKAIKLISQLIKMRLFAIPN
jgi:hypothetical protein